MPIFRELVATSYQNYVMVVFHFASSGLWSPLDRDGNEIQEIWKTNACRHYMWYKVRVNIARHVKTIMTHS